jgi:hypothetical protein
MIDGIDGQRGAEMVVMGRVVDDNDQPLELPVSEIVEGMTAENPDLRPARDKQTQDAIAGLIEVGLLEPIGDSVRPTPAGLRSVELQLYL